MPNCNPGTANLPKKPKTFPPDFAAALVATLVPADCNFF